MPKHGILHIKPRLKQLTNNHLPIALKIIATLYKGTNFSSNNNKALRFFIML